MITAAVAADCLRPHAEDDDDDDEEHLVEDQSRMVQCKYYFSSGGWCKYGQSCRYSHFKANSSYMNLNFIGLPIRWGEKECPYYMRTGSCGYGLSCRFNHPHPTSCARSDLYNQNLVPQGVLQSFEDSGYQVPSYFQERDVDYHPTPALSSFTELGELPLEVEEFPQRPGQPNCEYFMKTGGCKFKSACWYHHPKFQPVITDVLNDKGLPLRPGRKVCWHYENCGICKYGPSCLFDHP